MKLEFERKNKTRMIGVRLTDEEYRAVTTIAKKNKVTTSESARQLVRAALKDVNYNG